MRLLQGTKRFLQTIESNRVSAKKGRLIFLIEITDSRKTRLQDLAVGSGF